MATAEHAARWFAEILDEAGPRPATFVDPVHEFGSFDEVDVWLSHPDTVNVARAVPSAHGFSESGPKFMRAGPSGGSAA